MRGFEERTTSLTMSPVVYDITRLLTRMASAPTPTGIDRVDFAYAGHFLSDVAPDNHRALALMVRGPRTIAAPVAARAIATISRNWQENQADEEALRTVFERLRSGGGRSAKPVRAARRGAAKELARLMAQIRPFGGANPARDAPRNAFYLSVSQFGIWFDPYLRWMDSRPDVKPVFMIHDLLMLEFPEYFPPSDQGRHEKRLAAVARRAVAAITPTESVRERLTARLVALGRKDMPIHVAHLPVDPTFWKPRSSLEPSSVPYFVACSTIEPRKNHLLLLHIWRKLVQEMGPAAPKLVIVGRRGWENENVVDLLERCPALKDAIIEVSGLSTPALKALFDGALAVLMPTFGEGFGLPVAEALAADAPVIAADIPSLREIAGSRATLLHPLDGLAWMSAIRALTSRPREAATSDGSPAGDGASPNDWPHYFEGLEKFMAGL